MSFINSHRRFLNGIIFVHLFIVLLILAMTVANLLMYIETKPLILSNTDYTTKHPHKEYAIVLGASVHGERLSHALQNRVNAAINLYRKGLVNKILMSGDGLESNYNEPLAMKKYAIRKGVPESAIETDPQGINTYASMLRAREIYHIHDAYIISQLFHVGRALWIAKHLDIQVEGVSVGKFKPFDYYSIREFFARFKDFLQILLKHSYLQYQE